MTATEQRFMSCAAQNQTQIAGICKARGFGTVSNKKIKEFMLKNPQLLNVFQARVFFVCVVFFSFIFISWRLITLQYCSGFCHTLT